DHAGERLVVRRTDDQPSVDEERRCALDADARAFLLRRLPRLLVLARRQAGIELVVIELDLVRVAIEIAVHDRTALREQFVVHLPELSLLLGAMRSFRGALGRAMHDE